MEPQKPGLSRSSGWNVPILKIKKVRRSKRNKNIVNKKYCNESFFTVIACNVNGVVGKQENLLIS